MPTRGRPWSGSPPASASTEPTAVLTTSKDAVKLHGRLDLPLAELPIRAEPETAFWAWLVGRLDGLSKGLR